MKRRSVLSAAPQIALAAAGAFAAGRVSASRLAPAPPCGSGVAGGRDARPSEPAVPAVPPATEGPTAAPRLVPPLPTPTAAEQAWLQEWLDLVARPTGTAAAGC
jgi:hypothetical protein